MLLRINKINCKDWNFKWVISKIKANPNTVPRRISRPEYEYFNYNSATHRTIMNLRVYKVLAL